MRQIQTLLTILCLLSSLFYSCSNIDSESDYWQKVETGKSRVFLSPCPSPLSSNEDVKINDINILVFNCRGVLEQHLYFSRSEMDYSGELERDIEFDILYGTSYGIYVMANLGYKVNITSLEAMKAYEYPISYPGEMISGMPMAGFQAEVQSSSDATYLKIPLERLYARVDLKFDRTALNEDVDMRVAGARVIYSPKMIRVFGESKPETSSQFFLTGQVFGDDAIWKLNNSLLKDPLEIYILENTGNTNGYRPYLEVQIDYLSGSYYTPKNEYLIYRTFLSESNCLRRNTVYPLTLIPEGTGLGSDPSSPSWKIDASALKEVK